MDEFVLNFKKVQTFIERLKERVETAMNEKDEEIGQLRDELKRMDNELKRCRRENEALREEVRNWHTEKQQQRRKSNEDEKGEENGSIN
ncbi:hypothetical protein niasHS_006496 [Heterodera schachtii]|uniref:Uncharacterized protein n=1 Tax=Heterodera schachtii TaxID=97005 RepID=A0ABD2JHE6_HETSC